MRFRLAAMGALLSLVIVAGILVSAMPARSAPELAPEPRRRTERAPLEPHIRWIVPLEVRADPPPPRWLPVSGDALALVAPPVIESPRVIVYLHGMCGDPQRSREWAPSVQAYGTLIALHADAPCISGNGHYWRSDPIYLDYRIRKAIRSVSAELGRPLDDSDITLIGYSQGAERAEELGQYRPSRYGRIALMSGPYPPSYARVARVERVVVTRGGRERQREFRLAVDGLRAAGMRAAFFELPGARHGEFGPEIGQVMGGMLEHLLD